MDMILNSYPYLALMQHLQQCPNVQFLAPAEIGGLHYEALPHDDGRILVPDD